MRAGITAAFFISGFVSLTFQVVWRKALSQTVGVDYYSTALIVTIFMLGLALGAELGKACLRRMSRPLIAVLLAEAFVSFFGLFSIAAIRWAPSLSGYFGAGLSLEGYVADFAANALLLLLPTIAMGVSLPIIVPTSAACSHPAPLSGSSIPQTYSVRPRAPSFPVCSWLEHWD